MPGADTEPDLPINERILIRMAYTLNLQIDIKVRPIKMGTVQKADSKQLVYGGLPKPGIVLIIQEILCPPD